MVATALVVLAVVLAVANVKVEYVTTWDGTPWWARWAELLLIVACLYAIELRGLARPRAAGLDDLAKHTESYVVLNGREQPGELRRVWCATEECGERRAHRWIVDDFRLGTFRTKTGARWARRKARR